MRGKKPRIAAKLRLQARQANGGRNACKRATRHTKPAYHGLMLIAWGATPYPSASQKRWFERQGQELLFSGRNPPAQ